MARKEKYLIDHNGVDKREIGYYSTHEFVAEFITQKMLEIKRNGTRVLDPCVGKEELLKFFLDTGIECSGIDVFRHKKSYESNFYQKDFINFYSNRKKKAFFNNFEVLEYDYYIANPPYNCHEIDYIKNNKDHLKKIFNPIGVHNMYSMFISAIIDFAKNDSVIGLITYDSFLTSKAHEKLRKKILNNCTIHYLALCPTDLFLQQGADVRTCILILQKGKDHQGLIKTSNRPLDTSEFKTIIKNNEFEEFEESELVLDSKFDNGEIVVGLPDEIRKLFRNERLGDKFRCITGISTGNDSKYLSEEQSDLFKYPFYKNPGSRKFYTEPDAYLTSDFLELDKSVKNFMVRNKKLLFREGITCSSMGVEFSACYLPPNSTFGVNANIICSQNDLWWLLSYLNSSLVTYLVRGILNRSNMVTSGYVSRIPIPKFNEDTKEKLSECAKRGYLASRKNKQLENITSQIDQVIFNDFNVKYETREEIKAFNNNVIKLT